MTAEFNIIIWIFILSILSIGYVFENGKFKGGRFPFLTFVLLFFYHDFIFINLSYYLKIDSIVLSSSWKEVILLILATFVFLGSKVRSLSKFDFKIITVSMLFVLYGVFLSATDSAFFNSILMGKGYIFPFLFLCVLILVPDTKIDIKKSCNLFFYFVVLPNFLFGFWELSNVKDLGDLWFYDALVSRGNHFESFNHFRGGIVRVNGFFVGTLSYAATAFCSFMFFFILRKDRFSYLKIMISFSMLFFSQTRTFFIGIVFFFLFYFLSKTLFNKKISSTSIIALILTFFLITLLSLPLITQEFSAIGRVYQWGNALNLLLTHPMGQGFASIGENGANRADSQIIDLIRIYGLFIGPLLFGFISLIVFHWKQSKRLFHRNDAELPYVSAIAYVFVLFFQSLVNVAILYFILLLIFKYRNDKRFNYE